MSDSLTCERVLSGCRRFMIETIRQFERGIEENNLATVKECIHDGVDVNAITPRNRLTPLELALQKRSVSMVQLLLDRGADIEQNCSQGSTLLIAACRMGYMEGVQLLVDRGANLKARSTEGLTCLLVALENGHHSIADYLLDQDICEINGIGRDGYSALHHAVILNSADLMRKLIYDQADVNVQNQNGEVPVFIATRHHALDLLHMLLEAGADPNKDTKVMFHDDFCIMGSLYSVKPRSWDGDFALHEAVRCGDAEAVELLLQHGADRDRLDKSGMTPLEVAMALVPPPQDIIHSLLPDTMCDQESRGFAPIEDRVSNHAGPPAEEKKKILDAELEQSLCCPITLEIMKDPVIAIDGHTYEREAIEQWIREKKTSPVTRQTMTTSTLTPNLAIKHLIDQFANVDSNS